MTVQEFYEAVGGDYDDAIRKFMDDRRILKYLRIFAKGDVVNNLQQALDNANYEEAFRIVHNLKGTTANMSLTNLSNIFIEITEELRGGSFGPRAAELFEQIKVEYPKCIELIAQIG